MDTGGNPMPVLEVSRARASGQRVKEARERAGLTQQELADRVGVGRVSIGKVEGGTRKPSMELGVALSEALGVSLDDLFGGER
jgi:DNA-binding XRE family transcriptional regulator